MEHKIPEKWVVIIAFLKHWTQTRGPRSFGQPSQPTNQISGRAWKGLSNLDSPREQAGSARKEVVSDQSLISSSGLAFKPTFPMYNRKWVGSEHNEINT